MERVICIWVDDGRHGEAEDGVGDVLRIQNEKAGRGLKEDLEPIIPPEEFGQ